MATLLAFLKSDQLLNKFHSVRWKFRGKWRQQEWDLHRICRERKQERRKWNELIRPGRFNLVSQQTRWLCWCHSSERVVAVVVVPVVAVISEMSEGATWVELLGRWKWTQRRPDHTVPMVRSTVKLLRLEGQHFGCIFLGPQTTTNLVVTVWFAPSTAGCNHFGFHRNHFQLVPK